MFLIIIFFTFKKIHNFLFLLHLVNIFCYFWTEVAVGETEDYYSDDYSDLEYWDGGVARVGQAGDYYYYYEDEYYIDRQSGSVLFLPVFSFSDMVDIQARPAVVSTPWQPS